MKTNHGLFGAAVGDIAGSSYEFSDEKPIYGDPLFPKGSRFTDDTVLTAAVIDILSKPEEDAAKLMQSWARRYPKAGYGGNFSSWIDLAEPKPYGSFGNGAAMRTSACGYLPSLDEVKAASKQIASLTHNHPESLRAAEAVSVLIYLANHGEGKAKLREIALSYYPEIALLDYRHLLDTYTFDVSCRGSVPQALYIFLSTSSFEDCLRKSLTIGGDSDTIAAIDCSIAEAFYGVPEPFIKKAKKYLDETLFNQLNSHE